jgi:hypothetical protein
MVRRLLPEHASVRKIGGEDLMAWTRGREWPQEVARLYRGDRNDAWRIEEQPTGKRADDFFLHVLYACDKGTPPQQMPKCELVTRDNLTGVKVDYLGRTCEVVFRRDGGRSCAGRIRILESGKVLLDEPLVERVVPTFDVKPPIPDLN